MILHSLERNNCLDMASSEPETHDNKMQSNKIEFEKIQNNDDFYNQLLSLNMKEFVISNIDNLFVENLPSDTLKELPSKYLYGFGTIVYSINITIFVLFFIYNYHSQINQSYMSLENTGNCRKVPLGISGLYLLDRNGKWNLQSGFELAEALYTVVFDNYEAPTFGKNNPFLNDIASYQTLFNDVANYNLAYNLILGMTFISFYDDLQYFQITGEVPAVFEINHYTTAKIMSVSGICLVYCDIDYDYSTTTMTSTWPVSLINASSICSEAIYIDHSEYNIISGEPIPNPNTVLYIQQQLDLHTFTITMSLNLGYISLNTLYIVNNNQSTSYEYKGVSYLLRFYSDSRYSMEDVICAQNQTEIPLGGVGVQQLCVFEFNNYLALPTFNHMGMHLFEPEYCDCNSTIGTSKECNMFNLMSGTIYYKRNSSAYDHITDITRFIELVGKYNSYQDFNRAAYSASLYGYGVDNEVVNSSAYIQAFDFCNIPDNNNVAGLSLSCSIITLFNIADPYKPSYTINYNELKITNGSCKNSFAVTLPYLESLPIDFYQPYFKCKPGKIETVINALGVSDGNTSLLVMILVFISVPLLYQILNHFHQLPPKEEYTVNEKKLALEALAVVLMRIRDGKREGISSDGTLVKLTNELMRIAHVNEIELQAQLYSENKQIQSPDNMLDLNILEKYSTRNNNPKLQINKRTKYDAFMRGKSKNDEELMLRANINNDINNKDYDIKSTEPNAYFESVQSILDITFNIADMELVTNHDIDILNLPQTKKEHKHLNHTVIDIEVLLFDMNDCFRKALLAAFSNNRYSNKNDNSNTNKSIAEGDDSFMYKDHTTRNKDFEYGERLSLYLSKISLDEILKRDYTHIFLLIANTLVMHASISQKKEMREIINKQANHIAYNVGGKVLTYDTLVNLTYIKSDVLY